MCVVGLHRNNWPVEIKGLPSAYRMDYDTAEAWEEVMLNRTPEGVPGGGLSEFS